MTERRVKNQGRPTPASTRGTSTVQQENNQRILVGEAEAAKILGISRRKLFDLRKSGQVPVAHLGRRVLYRVAALEEFAAKASTFNDGGVA